MLSFLLMLCVGPILDFCHFCILPILPNILALTELFFKFHIFAPLSNQQPSIIDHKCFIPRVSRLSWLTNKSERN